MLVTSAAAVWMHALVVRLVSTRHRKEHQVVIPAMQAGTPMETVWPTVPLAQLDTAVPMLLSGLFPVLQGRTLIQGSLFA